MNERRKFITRKVFKKLDPHKNGSVNLLEIRKLYSAKKHPFVSKGVGFFCKLLDQFICFRITFSSRNGRKFYPKFI